MYPYYILSVCHPLSACMCVFIVCLSVSAYVCVSQQHCSCMSVIHIIHMSVCFIHSSSAFHPNTIHIYMHTYLCVCIELLLYVFVCTSHSLSHSFLFVFMCVFMCKIIWYFFFKAEPQKIVTTKVTLLPTVPNTYLSRLHTIYWKILSVLFAATVFHSKTVFPALTIHTHIRICFMSIIALLFCFFFLFHLHCSQQCH